MKGMPRTAFRHSAQIEVRILNEIHVKIQICKDFSRKFDIAVCVLREVK